MDFIELIKLSSKQKNYNLKKNYCKHLKHNFKILKEVFVNSIYSSKYMVLVFKNCIYKHYGTHFSKPIFTYLHSIFA
jgi:hypothetical protein